MRHGAPGSVLRVTQAPDPALLGLQGMGWGRLGDLIPGAGQRGALGHTLPPAAPGGESAALLRGGVPPFRQKVGSGKPGPMPSGSASGRRGGESWSVRKKAGVLPRPSSVTPRILVLTGACPL